MCLEQQIVPVALFRCLKIRSLTFALIFDHDNMTLESFCTSEAQIRMQRATQICINFSPTSTGIYVAALESWLHLKIRNRGSTILAQVKNSPMLHPRMPSPFSKNPHQVKPFVSKF